ncbi:MAG: type II toxin-antitoxin system HicB family antitoxin [Gammaproteobacteria bacterium]|nr:MAG: type II toxin-antitoxin system HicB family antitoxin [Gammaproteobacteria bacterium]
MKYLIVIEKTATGYSSYSPDMDGCIAAGKTTEEVQKNMQEALQFHIDGLKGSL